MIPLVSHIIGIFLGWLNTKYGLGLTTDQHATATNDLTRMVIFAGTWIGTYIAIQFKLNPMNAIRKHAVEAGKEMTAQRTTEAHAEARAEKAGLNDRANDPNKGRSRMARSSKGICGPGASKAIACVVGSLSEPPGTRIAGLRKVSLSITRLMPAPWWTAASRASTKFLNQTPA